METGDVMKYQMYKLVQSSDAAKLEVKVQALMALGWEVSGAVSYNDGYLQAMIAAKENIMETQPLKRAEK
jgi:hypothetical protein